MIKKAILALSLFLLATSASAEEPSRDIKIGEKLSLHSRVLDEDRPYWVYLPATYKDRADLKYPVLYLLDGDAFFHSATGVVQFMSSGINANLQVPELIVVAVPNTDRTRDLTPTHTKIGLGGTEAPFLESSGGGDNFLKFVREELFPQIESTYRTLPYRILVGHSFGGLLALHALLDAPEMFQAYIAIDPSLWWDDQVLVHRAGDRFKEALKRPISVFISLANNPDVGFGDPKMAAESVRQFAKSLESAAPLGLRSKLEPLAAEDHGAAPLISLYQGLWYIFEGYKPPTREFIEDPSSLGTYYKRLSEKLGTNLPPPESLVNRTGYRLLYQVKDVDKAIELFKLNVTNFPGSSNTYDSLAEAYMVKGEKSLAIENYEKSLRLDPENENATKRLKELRGQ